jgi:hypothetical protein
MALARIDDNIAMEPALPRDLGVDFPDIYNNRTVPIITIGGKLLNAVIGDSLKKHSEEKGLGIDYFIEADFSDSQCGVEALISFVKSGSLPEGLFRAILVCDKQVAKNRDTITAQLDGIPGTRGPVVYTGNLLGGSPGALLDAGVGRLVSECVNWREQVVA